MLFDETIFLIMCKLKKPGVQGNTILLLWTHLNEVWTVFLMMRPWISAYVHTVKKILAIHWKKIWPWTKYRQTNSSLSLVKSRLHFACIWGSAPQNMSTISDNYKDPITVSCCSLLLWIPRLSKPPALLLLLVHNDTQKISFFSV